MKIPRATCGRCRRFTCFYGGTERCPLQSRSGATPSIARGTACTAGSVSRGYSTASRCKSRAIGQRSTRRRGNRFRRTARSMRRRRARTTLSGSTSSPSPELRLTVITPSLNQGRYLERTILSVLDQEYEDLEYIVIDGGSTDGSAEILRRYSDRLAYWVSEPDRGQVDAINRGIQRSTGDVVAYINADDYYMPGAFAAAIDGFATQPSAGFVYGSAVAVDEQEHEIVRMPARNFDLEAFVFGAMYVAQAATFMSRQALLEVGSFSADL